MTARRRKSAGAFSFFPMDEEALSPADYGRLLEQVEREGFPVLAPVLE